MEQFILGLPKAELHLHLEGTFEPELMFKIAQRNNLKIKYSSVDELRAAYNFGNLQDFLDIYYAGASVLTTEQDFYDLTKAYLDKAHVQGVIHTEVFFDPQTHTDRGISFETVISGIHRALEVAREEYGLTSKLIMSFLRHLSGEAAGVTWQAAQPYLAWIDGVGLDSSEVGHPPHLFVEVYTAARQAGLHLTAHAGEEGPAEYIEEALDLLKVERIDHGNHALDDEELLERIKRDQVPLTLCPLSNQKLQVVPDLTQHPLKKMLNKGLLVTINSDDPAYFGGYVNENWLAVQQALDLSFDELVQLAQNSVQAAWLTPEEKSKYLEQISTYYQRFLLTNL